MPIVELHVLEGYDSDAKRRLGEALTDAVRFVVPAPADLVTIMIHEMPANNYYRGRTARSGAAARSDPCDLIRRFLAAMEARDVEAAQSMLANGITMQFPGAAPMTQIPDLIAWAKPRYRFVTKSYDGFDAMQGSGDAAIVYCRGTLSGAWLDGTPFEGIRFIDRFEIEDDKITRQEVWNDMAEAKAQI